MKIMTKIRTYAKLAQSYLNDLKQSFKMYIITKTTIHHFRQIKRTILICANNPR